MFKRAFRSQDSGRVDRVEKVPRLKNKQGSSRDATKASKLQRSLTEQDSAHHQHHHHHRQQRDHHRDLKANNNSAAPSPSPIVTLTVGREGRLFAAHEDVLRQAPFFESACNSKVMDSQSKRISLPDEEPEVFSAVLEYLYKGDYYPRLIHNRTRNSWELEDQPSNMAGKSPRPSPNPNHHHGGGRDAGDAPSTPEAAVYLESIGADILRDTVIYCAAERYGLEELKRLALRKQGLQAGIDVATILRSAQYAYAHTPDTDSRLRAHYLALIIRCRKTFKRSGTMQAEMEAGGSKLFFDLFVAMCNHLDDVIDVSNARTPKTV